MEIAFRVRGVEVPEPVRGLTREKVVRLAEPCGIDRAVVWFSQEGNPRVTERDVCRITLFGPGRIVQAHATGSSVTVAAERVVGKLERRARRLRGRLAGRRYPRWCPVPLLTTTTLTNTTLPTTTGDGWLHFPANRSTARREPGAVDLMVGGAGEAADMGGDSENEPMTPEEAALEMAAGGAEVYFFLNAETGRSAAVYLRRDGDIGLYDSAGDVGRAEVVT